MRLYPPFNKTTTYIKHPEIFQETLKAQIGSKGGKLKWKTDASGFKAEINPFVVNVGRPYIKGVISTSGDSQQLTLSIESAKIPMVIVLAVVLLIVVFGIAKQSISAIPNSMVTLLFFYFGNWILHSADLKKTKLLKEQIAEMAMGTMIG